MARWLLAGSLVLLGALPLEAQTSPVELEEAAEVARRAATAALHGEPRVLFEALDVDPIVRRRVPAEVFARLSERQRQTLRDVVHRTFAEALFPARGSAAEIAWSAARPEPSGAAVFLGIRYGGRTVKTRWDLGRAAGGWRIIDITLSDPGVSLASLALEAMGPRPVEPRNRRERARQEALPRVAGLAAIALVVVLACRRLQPPKRLLLLLTASAPAVLFLADGALAVRRVLSEPYGISEGLSSRPPWERWRRLAREAEREGEIPRARELWQRAVAAGAPAGAVAYERGLAARDRADPPRARSDFEAALAARDPAPGAAKELVLLDLAEGKSGEARRAIGRYLEATGPDPDGLSILAVADANLGRTEEAVAVIRQARAMVGGGWKGAELEAQVRARAGDAAGAVSALRDLEREGRLDREALRSDPAYLPIANDPVWVAFLDQEPAAPGAEKPPTRAK